MKNKKAKILGVQIQPELGKKDINLEKVRKIIEENSWLKPDLVVLPEVFNSGIDHRYLQKLAESIPEGETTQLLSNLAKKHNTNIISGSYVEKCPDGSYKNSSVVFNRNGEIIGKYHKIHMFNYYGSNEGMYVSSGDSVSIVETDIGKIGLTVCYDIRFPELYRAMAYKGVDIITCVAAFPYPRLDHWVTLNKARAIENTVYMVAVNQCGRVNPKRQNLGMSMVINPWGDVIASGGSDEGAMIAEIDFEYLQKIREEFPVLNDRNMPVYENIQTY